MKKALISVFDKNKLIPFAQKLIQLGWEIISTGGTRKFLEKHQIPVIDIEEVTNFPEMLDGRVKTLHPKIHAGLLNVRNNKKHQQQIQKHKIDSIDLVVVNLYPFIETVQKNRDDHQNIIENIDIGGPSMLRSAAKNYRSVTVVCDIEDYQLIIKQLETKNEIDLETRQILASKVFNLTAYYDAHIANYLNQKTGINMPKMLTLPLQKNTTNLRYGENPHQEAAFYLNNEQPISLANAVQLQGKTLSYNNLQDASAALQIINEFQETAVVGLKHMNPCGVGIDPDIYQAWQKSYEGDSVSIFGGIVAANTEINEKTAQSMSKIFLEVIIATGFSSQARAIFAKKKNLRLLELNLTKLKQSKWQYKSINGGILRQEFDTKNVDDCQLEVVTKQKPDSKTIQDLKMAQKIVKHVKSNAIVIVKDQQLIGVGAGQMNRIGAVKIAIEQAGSKVKNAVLASDAFFPFSDVVALAGKHQIKAIIQPGGSIRDQESIEKADHEGIAMVFTKMRHFNH